ncbi:MAG: disulfide bond formation protein B [Proteobacteria bacterium]|nr:disulfide bond formation protein B [Pseudomonadota bacterium]
MSLPNKRVLNLAGFSSCAAMMAFALYSQHVLLLDPCPLCILQRIAVILLGIVFLVAAIHDPERFGSRVYAVLSGVIAIAGASIAGWHARLQNLPADEVPGCGPGLDYIMDNFPLQDALGLIFKGSGECAEIAWSLLGLSMPVWVLISLLGLGAVGVWNLWRS